MSALPPKTDMISCKTDVRLVPEADMGRRDKHSTRYRERPWSKSDQKSTPALTVKYPPLFPPPRPPKPCGPVPSLAFVSSLVTNP